MVGSVPRKCSRFSGCSATKSAPDWLACTPIRLAALGGAPAWQARAHFLQRFPRPSWLRTALWVGKLTDSRLCDSAFVWSEPCRPLGVVLAHPERSLVVDFVFRYPQFELLRALRH